MTWVRSTQVIFIYTIMKTKDLFPDEFFKQFKTGVELSSFLKELQERGVEIIIV